MLKLMMPAATAALILGASMAGAAPTGAQICQKMIADGRANGMSQAKCLCTYRVADTVLDEDIKTLLWDSWYNGTNNMAAVEKLPGRARVKKQMETMYRSLKPNCG